MVRPTAALLALLAFLASASGCASGGGPGGASGASGSAKRVVLVEADGAGPDVEVFVSRLGLESTEAGRFALTDARLSGARLGALAAEPTGERAEAFRRQHPGDAFLSVSVSPCVVASSTVSQWDTDPATGIRRERIIVNFRAECPVALTLARASDGSSLLRESVSGQATLRRGEDEEGNTAESEAVADAARRAAKKIAAALR